MPVMGFTPSDLMVLYTIGALALSLYLAGLVGMVLEKYLQKGKRNDN